MSNTARRASRPIELRLIANTFHMTENKLEALCKRLNVTLYGKTAYFKEVSDALRTVYRYTTRQAGEQLGISGHWVKDQLSIRGQKADAVRLGSKGGRFYLSDEGVADIAEVAARKVRIDNAKRKAPKVTAKSSTKVEAAPVAIAEDSNTYLPTDYETLRAKIFADLNTKYHLVEKISHVTLPSAVAAQNATDVYTIISDRLPNEEPGAVAVGFGKYLAKSFVQSTGRAPLQKTIYLTSGAAKKVCVYDKVAHKEIIDTAWFNYFGSND